MKKFILLSFLALVGFAGIVVLNSTEMSKMGYGVDLPVGWYEPPQTIDMLCTMQARFDEGLPFSTERPSGCETATNTLAQLLNKTVGISFGVVVGLLILKRLKKLK